MQYNTYFLVGGAGFIASHVIDMLLKKRTTQKVTIFDNFTVGKSWHYEKHLSDPRLAVIRGDAKDLKLLTESMHGHELVMHFASNSDISQAEKNPGIDFSEGVYLTFHVLEAARITHVKRIIYPSGSGVYGDCGSSLCEENQGKLIPISPYGASKLAGEAFIASYCYMFGLSACAFRFANVVGPRQTHGVAYDFIRHLKQDPSRLRILGDGTQTKSYIYVDDVIRAIEVASDALMTPFEVYNVATQDVINVREIADIVVKCMGLKRVEYQFTGGSRGWNGDVPLVLLNSNKLRSLGWSNESSSGQAIEKSVKAMMENTACRSSVDA